MAKYVRYDPTITDRPSPVTSLYDADMIEYTLPPAEELLEVNDDDWKNLAAPWAVENGKLITFTPPPPPPTSAEIASAAYDAFITGGLMVTSTATPALNGVYAIDAQSQSNIATEAQFITTFNEFTTGETTDLPWPMPDGSMVVFPTMSQFLSLAKVTGKAVAAAKLALAQSLPMPLATATIP